MLHRLCATNSIITIRPLTEHILSHPRLIHISPLFKMPPKEKYTDPELRDEVKEEVQAGDKKGAPGQWSARKAQFMASEYKKRGGGVSLPFFLI